MELLKLAVPSLAAAAVGCYAPELRDCTVACSAPSDCASGQVCGSDQLCAAPEIAGQCASLPVDAGPTRRDGGITDAMSDHTPDAAPPADASTHVALEVEIDGKGRISMLGIGTCDAAKPQNGKCTFIVPRDVPITVSATAYTGWRFDAWTTAACAVVPITTCTFTPHADTPVGVKFRKHHHGEDGR